MSVDRSSSAFHGHHPLAFTYIASRYAGYGQGGRQIDIGVNFGNVIAESVGDCRLARVRLLEARLVHVAVPVIRFGVPPLAQ